MVCRRRHLLCRQLLLGGELVLLLGGELMLELVLHQLLLREGGRLRRRLRGGRALLGRLRRRRLRPGGEERKRSVGVGAIPFRYRPQITHVTSDPFSLPLSGRGVTPGGIPSKVRGTPWT